jgi:aspartate/methionine/tyrosine aminotransferase
MNAPARTLQSDYMHFAKYGTTATYNLASSGVLDCEIDDLDLSWDDLALHGPNAGGYRPLMQRIADRFGIDVACVVTPGGGCSFTNHLAFAALVAPGDEVLVEDPTYELLNSTLGFLQARVKTFERRPDESWRLDVDRVVAAITPATRLIVLTNLHNPSSALEDDAAIHAVARAADKVGAHVLVDEVYRELTFAPGEACTSFQADGNIVVTSSLTKAYGLSGLRCGWILAPAPLAQKMSRLNDLFGVHPPHVAERMAYVAFDRLAALKARAEAMIDVNRASYRELLGGHPRLDQVIFDRGTTVFPRLVDGDVEALATRLMETADTGITPGRFFARPNHFRVGLGGNPLTTRVGLERLAEALG